MDRTENMTMEMDTTMVQTTTPGRGFPNQRKAYLLSLFIKSLVPHLHHLLPYLSFRLFLLPLIRRPSRCHLVLFHMPRSQIVLPHRHLHHPLRRHLLRSK